MNRILILHCGPMKTGSTAIQDALEINKKTLLELGISYSHIPAKTLLRDLEKSIANKKNSSNNVMLFSSEFFGQVDPNLLKKVLQSFDGICHAICVSRPLREVYPSLYLQNLKGSSRRITSFDYFLNRQVESDLSPEKNLAGQLMNLPALDRRLSVAGCQTHWIQYDRKKLLSAFVQSLEDLTGVSLRDSLDVNISKAKGLSPRRSLRMEVAGLARLINFLNRLNLLHDRIRIFLLKMLLDICDVLNYFLGIRDPLSPCQRKLCNDLDELINRPFLESRGIVSEM